MSTKTLGRAKPTGGSVPPEAKRMRYIFGTNIPLPQSCSKMRLIIPLREALLFFRGPTMSIMRASLPTAF